MIERLRTQRATKAQELEALDAKLEQVIDSINATGFGLTFGIHSRIDETIDHAVRRIRAGNIYVNRNIIGAVVGSQPFGGEGLSGTGFKAGGPYYLLRFASERTFYMHPQQVAWKAGERNDWRVMNLTHYFATAPASPRRPPFRRRP